MTATRDATNSATKFTDATHNWNSAPQSSNTFNVPAGGHWVYALVTSGSAGTNAITSIIDTANSVTFTQVIEAPGSTTQDLTAIWHGFYATAVTAAHVTVTTSSSSGGSLGGMIDVAVMAGDAASQTGAKTASHTVQGAAATTSLAGVTAGSLTLAAASNFTDNTLLGTPTGITTLNTFADATNGDGYQTGTGTLSGTNTLGWATPTTKSVNLVLCEVFAGVSSSTGSAAPAAVASVGAGAILESFGAAAPSSNGSVSTSGVVGQFGSSTPAAVASVGAGGTTAQLGSAAPSAVASVAASATLTKLGSAAPAVVASVSSAGTSTAPVAAAPAAKASMSGVGFIPANGSAAPTAVASVSAAGSSNGGKLLSVTPWFVNSGTSKTITIPAVATGNMVVVTSGGGAITTAQMTNSGGTAFIKRTTYGGGAADVSISDLTISSGDNGATAVFIALAGPENVAGEILVFANAMTFNNWANNGAGNVSGVSSDWQSPVSSATTITGNSVLIAQFCSSATGGAFEVPIPTQFGPLGKIVGSGQVARTSGSFVTWATAIADITPGESYPENLSAGSYQSTFATPANNGAHEFIAQAVYTDTSGIPTVTQVNPIVAENSLPGTDYNNWYPGVPTPPDLTIAGYADRASYSPGDIVNFAVDSSGATFRVEIYRNGWYGSDTCAARNVLGYQAGYITGTPTTQATPAVDATLGSTSCGWTQNASWTIPSNAVPGVYTVLFRRTDPGNTGRFGQGLFVVKGSSATGKVCTVINDATYQAYNDWGSTDGLAAGRNLYEISTSVGNPANRAYAVSWDRPYRTWVNHGNTWFDDGDLGQIVFMEAQGYDLNYYSCLDLENTTLLNSAKVVTMLGHHEYWTAAMYDAMTNAVDAGVNFAFLSSNTGLWHTRYAAADTNKRTMICYKDSLTVDNTAGFTGAGIDPVSYTGTWRDNRSAVSPFNTDIRSENVLTGQLFRANAFVTGKTTVPFASKGSPIWRNSASVQALTSGQTFTVVNDNLGDEQDWADGSAGQPANLVTLAPSSVTIGNNGTNQAGSTYTAPVGTVTVSATLYRRDFSGALIFNTGAWNWQAGTSRWTGSGREPVTLDLDLENALLSIFYDLGAVPGQFAPVFNINDTPMTDPSIGAPGPGNNAVAVAYGLALTAAAAPLAQASVSAAGSAATSGGIATPAALASVSTTAHPGNVGSAAPAAVASVGAGGVPTWLGAAAPTSSASVSTSGIVSQLGSAAPASAATVSTAGVVGQPSSAAPAAVASVSTSGIVGQFGSAAPAAIASVSTAGIVTQLGTATPAGAASVSTSAVVAVLGSAAPAAVASVAAAGSSVAPGAGAASPASVASVATAGTVTQLATAGPTSTSSVSTVGTVIVAGMASPAAVVSVSTVGTPGQTASATPAARASVNASAGGIVAGTASPAAIASVIATASAGAPSSAAPIARASVDTSGTAIASGAASPAGRAVVVAAGTQFNPGHKGRNVHLVASLNGDRLVASLNDDRLTASLNGDRLTATLGGTVRTINSISAGDTDTIVVVLLDSTAGDISSDALALGLGPAPTPAAPDVYTPPETWAAPSDIANLNVSTRVASILVGANGVLQPAAGKYVAWIQDSTASTQTSVPCKNQLVTIA